jgi:hypothetical protein
MNTASFLPIVLGFVLASFRLYIRCTRVSARPTLGGTGRGLLSEVALDTRSLS